MRKLFLLSLFAIIAFGAARLQAQPDAPNNFSARAQANGQYVTFSFSWVSSDDVTGFNLYSYDGYTADFVDMSILTSIPIDSIDYRDSLYFLNYSVLRSAFDSDTLSFAVTAENNGESEPSNFAYAVLPNVPVTIRFTTNPPTEAVYESDYVYEFAAEATDGGDVEFNLVDNAILAELEVDGNSGTMNWEVLEAQPGESVRFNLLATLADDPSVRQLQSWTVNVRECENPAMIFGTITDQSGDPIFEAMVELYSSENSLVDEVYYRGQGQYVFTIGNSGTYYIKYSPMRGSDSSQFDEEWWEDAEVFADATPIEVDCGDNVEANAVLNATIWPEITFDNRADYLTAYVDEEFSYVFSATHSLGEDVVYSAEGLPDGAQFDESTGEFTWTPEAAGDYRMTIIATEEGFEEIRAEMSVLLSVRNCRNNPVVVGEIYDENGDPIEFGMLYAYRVTQDSMTYFYNVRISQGSFVFPADAGEFYLYFTGQTFVDEWWEDAESADYATPFVIECDDTIFVEIEVQSIRQPDQYYVRGTVRELSNQEPIPYARVEFFGRPRNSNGDVRVFRTSCNAVGEYSMRLSDNYVYIAYASAASDSANPGDLSLLPQYYNRASDPSEAQELILTEDLNGIDFELIEREDYTNSMDGGVIDEDNTPVPGAYIVAYLVDEGPWNTERLLVARATRTDANGEYYIENLIPGPYVILAAPGDRNIVPGYYRSLELAARSWRDADQVFIYNSGMFGYYEVILPLRQAVPLGGGGVEGRVGVATGITKGGKDAPQAGEALHGAFVYLTDTDGNVIDYSRTDLEGLYAIDGLKDGKYQLTADKFGYEPKYLGLEIENEEVLERDADLRPAILSGVEEPEFARSFATVYPNPTSGSFRASFESDGSAATLILVDELGKEVLNRAVETAPGLNEIDLETDLPTGAYYLKIILDGKVSVIGVNVSK